MININSPIGVFDSGIGGLTVLRQLIRFMPDEHYIYLGDTARVPYGNKSPAIVQKYAEQFTRFLVAKNVKLIIVACNTVSSVALDTVKRIASPIDVIGMIEYTSYAALRSTVNNKIGIIGTRATINSNAYVNGILSLPGAENVKIVSQACPLFVPIVEEGLTSHQIAFLAAKEYLSLLKEEKVDTVVLGCTHYPLLSRVISEILPTATLIDCGEHSSVAALRVLAEKNLLLKQSATPNSKPNIEFYVTDIPSVFYEQAQRFLGFPIDSPKTIDFKDLL